MESFLTVKGFSEASLLINKSQFTAYTARVENEQEALAFIDSIKKKHWDATHNCSAYVLAGIPCLQKADDDGEPSGTAGKPILEVLHNRKLKNTAIVVTRYFGGIKLGAGGLIRAYSKAASLGVDAAKIVQRSLFKQYLVEIDYTLLGSVENQLRQHNYLVKDKTFTDKVSLVVLEKKGEENLSAQMADWTSGQAQITFVQAVYVETETIASISE